MLPLSPFKIFCVGLFCVVPAQVGYCQGIAHSLIDGDKTPKKEIPAPRKTEESTPRLLEVIKETQSLAAGVKIPLKRLYYGFREDGLRKTAYQGELVEETFVPGKRLLTRYRFRETDSEGFLFDPLPMPDGENVLFKFGTADFSLDFYNLYLFNRRTHQVTLVSPRAQRNSFVHPSPDGRYIALIVGGVKDGPDASYFPEPLELWVYEVAKHKSLKIAQDDALQNSMFWLTPQQNNGKMELMFARTGKQRIGKATISFPVLFLYDPQTQQKRLWLERVEVARASPNGQWLLKAGPRFKNKTFTDTIDNFQLVLQSRGKPDEKEVPRLPGPTVESIVPIFDTHWTPDGQAVFSVVRRQSLNEDLGNERGRVFWDMVRFDLTAQGTLSSPTILSTFTSETFRQDPEIRVLCFAASASTSAKSLPITTKAVSIADRRKVVSLFVAHTYRQETFQLWPQYAQLLQATFALHTLDLKNGKTSQLLSLNGVCGLSGLDLNSKSTTLVYY